MTPFNRLRQTVQQPELQQPVNPAPPGMLLQWQQGVGGEEEGDGQGLTDASGMLASYLKKRQLDNHVASLTDRFTGRGGPVSTTQSPLTQL